MTHTIYQVDAFAKGLFTGNPAAVCPLDQWLDDALMQQLAMENNLAETAFFVKQDDVYEIRWFTPAIEVDLCGHATMASAYVIFEKLGFTGNTIQFYSHRSGSLAVSREGENLVLDFPTDTIDTIPLTENLTKGLNIKPKKAYMGKTDYMLIYDQESDIRDLTPDFRALAELGQRGVIVTAPGDEVDFVSRFFAPQSGIDEDPATGSAHTTLTPYWAKELGKDNLTALQLSKRIGYFQCTYREDRVAIKGKARLYMEGKIVVE